MSGYTCGIRTLYEDIIHGIFGEGNIIEEDIWGSFYNKSVYIYLLPLWEAPDTANKLSVLLCRPKSILHNEVNK